MAEPIFLLSFRNSESLARIAARAGWRPVVERSADDAATRFISSGAAVAVIDARGAPAEGESAARTLADAAEANGAALLVLLSRKDESVLECFHAIGVTHFLTAPFSDQELIQALRFARRHSERLGNGVRAGRRATDERKAPLRESPGTPGGGLSAGRDPLTGLGDAAAAKDWLAERLAGAGAPLSAILVSVNRYDAVNAAFGRATGNLVLQAVAERMRSQLEGRELFAARLNGAEFAVLLADPGGLADARFLAGQLVEAIARPFAAEGRLIALGSRAGVAVAQAGDDPASLLRRAGDALTEARAADSAPVRVIEENGSAGSDGRLEIDLRRALTGDEIEIRFQPQVSITSGEVVGAEALARWMHPRHGPLDAAVLFAVAERSDYLAQLSEHVQRKAIAAAADWPEALRGLGLSVNITSVDILRPGFAAGFLDMVAASGFPPDRLTVEVTESGLIEDLAAAAALLARLREGGLRVAIDDFGTGYSSLAYLKALPLDCLKLDKRLSQDIAGSARDRIVVRGAIEMARSLGLTVVAEGVETEEQLALLAKEGCNLYQGFLCAPPVTGEELARIVNGARA